MKKGKSKSCSNIFKKPKIKFTQRLEEEGAGDNKKWSQVRIALNLNKNDDSKFQFLK
jgi:hypothetical protein